MLLYLGDIGFIGPIMILIFVALSLILLLWALIDILRSDFKDSVTKLVWIIVVIFVPFVGAILYLIMGRGQKANTTYRV
jgi:uncharacterized membrane protein